MLVGGDRAVVGLTAAARLWNLPLDVGRYEQTSPIEIFIGRNHSQPPKSTQWRFIRADRAGESDPPRTSIPQTIVDLAQTLKADQLAGLLGQSISGKRVTAAEVMAALANTGKHRQRQLLTDIASDTAGGVSSALERRFFRDVERAHGLPAAIHQANPLGIHPVDNLYEQYNLIVELDSRAYHRGVAAARDIDLDRTHSEHGYLTLRYTWKDVADYPCRTAQALVRTLVQRGWQGRPTSCGRCATHLLVPST